MLSLEESDVSSGSVSFLTDLDVTVEEARAMFR